MVEGRCLRHDHNEPHNPNSSEPINHCLALAIFVLGTAVCVSPSNYRIPVGGELYFPLFPIATWYLVILPGKAVYMSDDGATVLRNASDADALHLRVGVRRGAQPGADRQPPKFPRLQARGNDRHVQVCWGMSGLALLLFLCFCGGDCRCCFFATRADIFVCFAVDDGGGGGASLCFALQPPVAYSWY